MTMACSMLAKFSLRRSGELFLVGALIGCGYSIWLGELTEFVILTAAIDVRDLVANATVLEVMALPPLQAAALMFILVVKEELIFRKFGFWLITGDGYSNTTALIVTSLLFGLIHLIGSGEWLSVLSATIGGFLLGGLYIYTKRSFAIVVGVHWGHNLVCYAMDRLSSSGPLQEESGLSGLFALPVAVYAISVLLLLLSIRYLTRRLHAPC